MVHYEHPLQSCRTFFYIVCFLIVLLWVVQKLLDFQLYSSASPKYVLGVVPVVHCATLKG